jgi:2-haloacid dehalogenase
MTPPKALLFDVFGTVVDWRSSLIRELQAFAAGRGLKADWAALVDDWRAAYPRSLGRVLKGETAWTRLEALQRHSLEEICLNRGLAGLSATDLDEINLFWRRCRPWPDAVQGLKRLRRAFVVAALSNADVALLVEMARRGGLSWDMVCSTELFRSFKPHPSTYLGACELLGVAPGEAMMCAAHPADLAAAKALGLRTALIRRPREFGPGRPPELSDDWDLAVDSLVELAERLRA